VILPKILSKLLALQKFFTNIFNGLSYSLDYLSDLYPETLLSINYLPDRLDVYILILLRTRRTSSVLEYLPNELTTRNIISDDEMIRGSFEVNDEESKDLSKFVSILDSVDLSENSRNWSGILLYPISLHVINSSVNLTIKVLNFVDFNTE
jgi:hypothetical protein